MNEYDIHEFIDPANDMEKTISKKSNIIDTIIMS